MLALCLTYASPGIATINFHQVFKSHIQQMVSAGVPVEETEKAVEKRLEELETEGTRNYDHTVDVARLLKMPLDELEER